MKLRELWAMLLPVSDLTPLQGLPLKSLDLYHTTGVTNLQPLKGMPLEQLNLQDVPVSDPPPTVAERTPGPGSEMPSFPAKQSFTVRRSQTEFGNKEK
jgi:hypothetical protein